MAQCKVMSKKETQTSNKAEASVESTIAMLEFWFQWRFVTFQFGIHLFYLNVIFLCDEQSAEGAKDNIKGGLVGLTWKTGVQYKSCIIFSKVTTDL